MAAAAAAAATTSERGAAVLGPGEQRRRGREEEGAEEVRRWWSKARAASARTASASARYCRPRAGLGRVHARREKQSRGGRRGKKQGKGKSRGRTEQSTAMAASFVPASTGNLNALVSSLAPAIYRRREAVGREKYLRRPAVTLVRQRRRVDGNPGGDKVASCEGRCAKEISPATAFTCSEAAARTRSSRGGDAEKTQWRAATWPSWAAGLLPPGQHGRGEGSAHVHRRRFRLYEKNEFPL
ncbi:unnamed protein product [Miscanthus lutarioriparius]|uniref:Uncharacterized protein n=1 Tax=Miscanthus lutarioriparius TaxID=422564 RepID=A0A811N675_9POAL|nr:unnamed protein product [Miscanthus lutarioriparius]